MRPIIFDLQRHQGHPPLRQDRAPLRISSALGPGVFNL
jgi:hypothetical protein